MATGRRYLRPLMAPSRLFPVKMSPRLVLFCLTVCFLSVAYGIPPPRPGNQLYNLTHVPVAKRTSFKTKWVSHAGGVYDQQYSNCIRIDATTSVSAYAHQIAANIVAKMTTHMADGNFARAASQTKIGVFTEHETLAVYPEYHQYATFQCSEHQCSGTCHTSCTFDGRQYYTLAGSGGARAVIADSNLLCNDGYHGDSNILVHEYAHSIHGNVLDSGLKSRITAAFANARNKGIWTDRYAMSNEQEYFAVGTAVYFHSDTIPGGGSNTMKMCGGSACTSEYAARTNLYQRDILLYGILYDVFSDKPGNLKPCMKY